MSKQNVHVVPRGDQWVVRREGAQRDSSHHPTQADAINVARQISQREQTELVIHRPDGRIRDKDSHGRDPFPPQG